jgi:hypothetical protein
MRGVLLTGARARGLRAGRGVPQLPGRTIMGRYFDGPAMPDPRRDRKVTPSVRTLVAPDEEEGDSARASSLASVRSAEGEAMASQEGPEAPTGSLTDGLRAGSTLTSALQGTRAASMRCDAVPRATSLFSRVACRYVPLPVAACRCLPLPPAACRCLPLPTAACRCLALPVACCLPLS